MALLNARRVIDLDITIPPVGGWYGDVILESGQPLAAGAASLTIGDLTLVGTILPERGGLDAPDRPHLVLAGGYGWRARLPAPGGDFKSTNGVRLSTVLAALAAAAGETYDAPTEAKVGTAYGWAAGTRGRAVLADLVKRGVVPLWRVDPTTGRTRFDAWPTLPPADSHGRIVDRHLEQGLRYVALDNSVSAWLPGGSVQGVRIATLELHEHAEELRIVTRDS